MSLPFFLFVTAFSSLVAYCAKDKIVEKYDNTKTMYNYLYHVNEESHFKTVIHIAQSTWELIRVYLTQYIFHNSKRIGKNLYDIEYTIHCKPYRFQTRYKLGPSKFKKFMKNESIDVSDLVFPYVGPNDDFHGLSYSPKDLGLEQLIIHYQDGQVKSFSEHEIILIS